ncbi:MAG TPA: tetratricopeptide repeat protein [Pirellulales bacterium]|nr:tetratricopeptide repeat protein [Pirellulales bacterium]
MALCLFLGTCTVYRGVAEHGFSSFDDGDYVTHNRHVQAGLTRESIVWALTSFDAANWFPLTWLSLELDAQLYGANPGAFHLTNVVLHSLSGALLFLIWWRFTGAVWRSALVAGLFLLHPLRVESVAWVSERKDVLSALFWMLTLAAYGNYVRSPSRMRYALLAAAFGLGLCAKQMLVTLPLVLFLLDWWPLARTATAAPRNRSDSNPVLFLLVEKLPLVMLALLSAVATVLAQRGGNAVIAVVKLPLDLRLANALVSTAVYLKKTVWPVDLAAFYPYPTEGLPWWQLALAGLTAAGVTALAVYQRRRRPYLLVGWMWYLITLLPVCGVIQVGGQAMADRYTYLPSIGLYVIFAWGLGEWASTPVRQRLAVALSAALLCGSTVLTERQLERWGDGISLWQHTISVTGPNPVAESILASEFIGAGRADDALPHLKRSLELRPGWPNALYNLGIALAQLGRFDEAESALREAVANKPLFATAHYELGKVYLRQQRLPEAQHEFLHAIETAPELVAAHDDLGEALERQGKLEAATDAYAEAVRLAPDNVEYRLNLAFVLDLAGQTAQAQQQFDISSRLVPDWPLRARAAAWALATDPEPNRRDGFLAIRYARQASRAADGRDPLFLDVLAAAYAEAHRYDDAAAAARKALDLAREAQNEPLKEAIAARLAQYEHQQPYRSDAR